MLCTLSLALIATTDSLSIVRQSSLLLSIASDLGQEQTVSYYFIWRPSKTGTPPQSRGSVMRLCSGEGNWGKPVSFNASRAFVDKLN